MLYVLNGNNISRTILGGNADNSHAEQNDEDEIVLLYPNGTHCNQKGWVLAEPIDFAVKFIQKPAARIGGKEVAIEAKELIIESLRKQLENTTDEAKRAYILEQIAEAENSISALYAGSSADVGLYALMRSAVELAVQHEDIRMEYQASLSGQQAVEDQFAVSMGEMLIDGYWSNTCYAPGQEEQLYLEACEVIARLSKPAVSYSSSIQNLSCVRGFEKERFGVGQLLRIWDEALSLNDQAYVSKLAEH